MPDRTRTGGAAAGPWRRRVSILLACLTAVLLAAAVLSGYARAELGDAPAFTARAAHTLDDADVRAVLAQRTVDGLVARTSDDLLAVRPLLVTAVEALADTAAFRRVFRLAVGDVHGVLFRGRSSLILDLDRGTALLLDALRSVSPDVARRIPEDAQPQLTELSPDDTELTVARALNDLAGWWWPLIGLTALCALGSLVTAPLPRRALARLGAAVAAAGAAVAALVWVGGMVVVSEAATAVDLDEERERAAIEAVWDALFGDLQTAALLLAFAGTAIAAIATGALAPGQLTAASARARRVLRSPTRAARLGRGAALIAAGAAILVEPRAVLELAVVVVGCLLVFVGVSEVAAGIERRAAAPTARGRGPVIAVGAAGAAALVAAVAVGLIALAIPAPDPETEAARPPAAGCNGARELCDRRLNEVAFAATHNSFSATDRPGWLFANQRHPISRQLADGVRALFLDIHYGVRDPVAGRVRTDLRREGRSRNRVARELSAEALRTADRLVGRVGLGRVAGPSQPYLCHTLCELGAEPLDQQLGVIKRFLERNPGEVLILYVEPYVAVRDIERAFDRHGLLPWLARLDRAKPLPTLGELVRAGTRIVVFTERGGGARPWYLPAFSYLQDTSLGGTRPAELRTCRRNRGDRDSPMLLVNHWIDAFPPSPSRNARIGGAFLRERLRRCERARGMLPNLVAVDFYERAGVVGAVAALNRRG
jgi:hypothetical protein